MNYNALRLRHVAVPWPYPTNLPAVARGRHARPQRLVPVLPEHVRRGRRDRPHVDPAAVPARAVWPDLVRRSSTIALGADPAAVYTALNDLRLVWPPMEGEHIYRDLLVGRAENTGGAT